MLTMEYNFTIFFLLDKASQLYDAMAQLRSVCAQNGHNGKSIHEVWERQRQRHLKEIK